MHLWWAEETLSKKSNDNYPNFDWYCNPPYARPAMCDLIAQPLKQLFVCMNDTHPHLWLCIFTGPKPRCDVIVSELTSLRERPRGPLDQTCVAKPMEAALVHTNRLESPSLSRDLTEQMTAYGRCRRAGIVVTGAGVCFSPTPSKLSPHCVVTDALLPALN